MVGKGEMKKKDGMGFTLIELSIVLVIISLIVGGVIAGRSLIRSAELRAVVTDVGGYRTAMNMFKHMYDSLPGDMSDATEYWPGVTSDGNNDKQIYTDTNEAVRAWQHMSLAEVIPGTYTGVDFGSPDHMPGVNVPAGPITSSGYRVTWEGPYYGRSANVFQFDGPVLTGGSAGQLWGPIITPAEARMIDKKSDDGIASTGDIIARNGSGISGCISSDNYNLSTTAVTCKIYFGYNANW